MKKLIAIFALLALANTANAELLKNFKWDGKIVVNAAATNNASDANSDLKDKTSDASAGVFLNASFDVTDDVEAIVSAVKSNRQYGKGSETVAAGTADGFTIEQAHLNLKGVLGIDHKIGRQYYGNEGDLVVYYGPRGWPYKYVANANPFSTSGIDAWTAWYKNDKLSVHALSAKLVNNDQNNNQPDNDTNLVGVSAKYELMALLNIGAYFYENNTSSATAASETTLDVVGVKADGKFEQLNLSYYGELVKNYGRKAAGVNYTGTAFLVGAKMDMDLIGKWTFMGEMGVGSGDKTSAAKDEKFTEIASDYRPGAVFSGVNGMTGLGNLTTWNLGAKWNTPMFEKLTLGGKLYHFSYTEKVISGGGFETDTIGNELDLTANWQHNESVGLMAYYGAFIPTGKYTKYAQNSATAQDDMATVIGATLNVKF